MRGHELSKFEMHFLVKIASLPPKFINISLQIWLIYHNGGCWLLLFPPGNQKCWGQMAGY